MGLSPLYPLTRVLGGPTACFNVVVRTQISNCPGVTQKSYFFFGNRVYSYKKVAFETNVSLYKTVR